MTERLQNFGTSSEGDRVSIAEIKGGGLRANILSWGATVQDLRMDGVAHPLVLGSSSLQAYERSMVHFSAIAGPVANRIANGRTMLNGRALQLDQNENDKTMLHGGFHGLSRVNWNFLAVEDSSCTLGYRFKDGTGGFPGDLIITAEYTLLDGGILQIILRSQADRAALCNLAFHGYWNLDSTPNIAEQSLQIFADGYLDIDEDKIPKGAPKNVKGTRFDYRESRPIWREGEPPLDHNFCLQNSAERLRPACVLRGRDLELLVSTTEPGLQVYDGYMMNTAPDLGLEGEPYEPMAGIALEPQKWPDAPNHPDYPSIEISPQSPYFQCSQFRIQTRRD